jgi:hypothetical protein
MDQRRHDRFLGYALSATAAVLALGAAFVGWRAAPADALTSYFIQSGGLIADYDYSRLSAADRAALQESARGHREANAANFESR